MISSITSIWALFLGIALITIGHGLQGTLLGVRGVLEGFSTGNMGIIMSCYYGGFLLGSLYIPRLVQRVGHIRVFAAFASLASITILTHSVILDPFVWGLIRVASGFSFAGLFVVAESWLNDQCTRENRGRMLSIYMGINHGGFLAGQVLLNLAAPEGFSLFILISILLSLALVPVLITASPAPKFDSPTPVSVSELFRISPTGMVGAISVGMAHGAVWGMGPVFAQKIGLDVAGVSFFMGAAILGGFLLQWPIGHLSDIFDRRTVLHTVTWLSALAAVICMILEWVAVDHLAWGFFIFGGCTLPLYSLCIAHTNDHLKQNQMVAASSTLILVYGAGALLGPAIASLWMVSIGPIGFFLHLLVIHSLMGGFVFYRSQKRAPIPMEEQDAFTHLPPRTSPMAAVLTPAPIETPAASSKASDESPL